MSGRATNIVRFGPWSGPASAVPSVRRDAVRVVLRQRGTDVAGIPFFYWYQLVWVILGAAIIGFVYLVER